MELNCNVFFKKNLHAKCYANENSAIVTSLNLYNYSEMNNREFGVLLSKVNDSIAYRKCIKEIQSIVESSEPYRLIKQTKSETLPLLEYNFDDFLRNWCLYLNQKFPLCVFNLKNGIIMAQNFPVQQINFSTKYGFANFELGKNVQNLTRLRNIKKMELEAKFKDHRFYWNDPSSICLYQAKHVKFATMADEIKYCFDGLTLMVEEVKKMFE